MSDPIFTFHDVSIRTFNKLVFEGLDFTARKGENWAIIGESGSGKSVLLDAIAGKTSFAKGEVSYPLFDQYITDHNSGNDPLFNRFKLIAQVSSRHHFRNLSNTTDFYYQQRFNSTDSEDSNTVLEYLSVVQSHTDSNFWTLERATERLKLNSLLDKQLIKLSNGETKRLLLASAIMKNPLLLLLDNPLTGLDVATRRDFNDLISEISESGITIIMATSPEEIPDAITNIAVLDGGKVKARIPKETYDPAKFDFSRPALPDVKDLDNLLSIAEMPNFQTIVKMENVTIKYGNKVILKDLDWEILQGDRWMLLGANGAGKSTLLSLINGDNPQAFANKITLFDKRKGGGESIWDIKKKIGFVSPELFQYFPIDNSCIQVIESGFHDTLGLFKKSSHIKAQVALRWMQLLEIDNLSGVLFKNVSVSVQRLCLLARALVKNPPLLIFDEPCQGLDHSQQESFRYLIDEICKRSRVTVIYVSHYESEKPDCVTKTFKLVAPDLGQA